MLEGHDPSVGTRARGPGRHYLGLEPERVADQYRHREGRLLEAQVGHRGAQRRVTHAYPDHQPQGQQAVHQAFAELGAGRELGIEVQGLRVVGHKAELEVVGLGDGAGQGMAHHEAYREFLEPSARDTVLHLSFIAVAHAPQSDPSDSRRLQRPAPGDWLVSAVVSNPLWIPDNARVAGTQVDGFRRSVGVDGGYHELHRWSVDHPADFWQAVWSQLGVVGDPGAAVLTHDGSGHLTGTRFFPDGRLNFAENLLGVADNRPALVFRGEDPEVAGARHTLTRRDLHHLVSRLQQAMLGLGVAPGDRVAAWMPNVPETCAVMLAAASIGATFSSTSPDFGASGVIDRFGQIRPVVLFASDGYRYGGRRYNVTGRLAEVADALPSLKRLVVVPEDPLAGPVGLLPDGAITLDEFLAPHQVDVVRYVDLPFDHPLYVLYSSGTTGRPKCIVHRAGGILLKHLVEHRLQCDVRAGDRVFYFTTAGWMMWNWLVSGLAADATVVLYDGSPFQPDGSRLFDLADECDLTFLGVSAKFIDSVAAAGLRPVETHALENLRTVCSTGSPLSHEGFAHVYADWSPEVHLASISGGTDLCGCLVAGHPAGPVHAGQIQGPVLGMGMDVVGEDGATTGPGVRGELVCRTAFPSMPLGFWDDPGDERYRAAYFDRFEGLWHQGDFAERTPEGGFVIHGRSDATLNPGGVRIGTAEIYRRVEHLDEIVEALVIGQPWQGDVRVVLFVVTADGVVLDDDLRDRIRADVRMGASPRHVPAVILEVPELPRTRSGKLVELAVRAVVEGRPITNVEALANPETLDHFRDLPELVP